MSSPFLPNDLKEYIKKHQIEDVLNTTVNTILKKKIEDPFAFMISAFEEKCSSDIKIENVKAFESLNNENMPTISIYMTLSYRMKSFQIVSNTSFSLANEHQINILYDENPERFQGKGMLKACELINSVYRPKLINALAQNQKKIDDLLISVQNKENQYMNIIWTLSFSVPNIIAKVLNVPLFKYIKYNMDVLKTEKNKIPFLIVNIFQGSKIVQSKCKIFKFQIWLESGKTANEKLYIVHRIVNHIKKTITSSKAGEAALKFYLDGSIICPADSINDNLKIIEDAIQSCGVKEDVKIGLCINADNFYLADQKKYELDNPKKPEDIDQLIEYWFKLCHERPSITYLEDPVFSEDLDGWKKLIGKFKDSHVKIGTRKIFSTLEKTKQVFEVPKGTKMSEEESKKFEESLLNVPYSFYKLGDFTTFSELVNLHRFLLNKQKKTYMILTENLTDSIDTSVVDLAYALEGAILCLNPCLKLERSIKFNKYIELENYE